MCGLGSAIHGRSTTRQLQRAALGANSWLLHLQATGQYNDKGSYNAAGSAPGDAAPPLFSAAIIHCSCFSRSPSTSRCSLFISAS